MSSSSPLKTGIDFAVETIRIIMRDDSIGNNEDKLNGVKQVILDTFFPLQLSPRVASPRVTSPRAPTFPNVIIPPTPDEPQPRTSPRSPPPVSALAPSLDNDNAMKRKLECDDEEENKKGDNDDEDDYYDDDNDDDYDGDGDYVDGEGIKWCCSGKRSRLILPGNKMCDRCEKGKLGMDPV